jgi:hypothetical protein
MATFCLWLRKAPLAHGPWGAPDGPRPENHDDMFCLSDCSETVAADGPRPDTQISNLCPFSEFKFLIGFIAQILTNPRVSLHAYIHNILY